MMRGTKSSKSGGKDRKWLVGGVTCDENMKKILH